MHDAIATSFDTIVFDDPDIPDALPTVARSRVSTAELTMHVLVLSQWHRRTPDLRETACGVATPLGSMLRREALTEMTVDDRPAGKLCLDCFTPHERVRAAKADQDARDKSEAEHEQWLAESDVRVQERNKRHDEITARLRAVRDTKKQGDR